MIDPSELLRPEPDFAEKPISKFRDYSIDETDPLKERVRRTYRLMHKNQTVDFVKSECLLVLFIGIWWTFRPIIGFWSCLPGKHTGFVYLSCEHCEMFSLCTSKKYINIYTILKNSWSRKRTKLKYCAD